MINMAFMPLYMWEIWDVTPVTHGGHTDGQVESRAVFSLSWIRKKATLSNNWSGDFILPKSGVLCSLFCSCDLVLCPTSQVVVCPQVGGSQQEHQHGARILWTQQRRAGRRRGPCNTPFVILNIVSVSLGIITLRFIYIWSWSLDVVISCKWVKPQVIVNMQNNFLDC